MSHDLCRTRYRVQIIILAVDQSDQHLSSFAMTSWYPAVVHHAFWNAKTKDWNHRCRRLHASTQSKNDGHQITEKRHQSNVLITRVSTYCIANCDRYHLSFLALNACGPIHQLYKFASDASVLCNGGKTCTVTCPGNLKPNHPELTCLIPKRRKMKPVIVSSHRILDIMKS